MPGSAEAGVGTARLSDGPLVGRVELMEELVAAANAAVRGSGSIVVLTGEAGIGKTTVARVLAREVRGRLEVSWGACVADQSAPPFWPWSALVAPRVSTMTGATVLKLAREGGIGGSAASQKRTSPEPRSLGGRLAQGARW